MEIFTDGKGKPIPKPDPNDYPNTTSWLRAYHAWHDRIADIANKAFTDQFRKSIKQASP